MKPLALTIQVAEHWTELLALGPATYALLGYITEMYAAEIENYKWLCSGPYGWELVRSGESITLLIRHQLPGMPALNVSPF